MGSPCCCPPLGISSPARCGAVTLQFFFLKLFFYGPPPQLSPAKQGGGGRGKLHNGAPRMRATNPVPVCPPPPQALSQDEPTRQFQPLPTPKRGFLPPSRAGEPIWGSCPLFSPPHRPPFPLPCFPRGLGAWSFLLGALRSLSLVPARPPAPGGLAKARCGEPELLQTFGVGVGYPPTQPGSPHAAPDAPCTGQQNLGVRPWGVAA